MSLLEQISKKKKELNITKTIITKNDGRKFLEDHLTGTLTKLNEKSYGFIVDTKPDHIPALIFEENKNKLYLGSQDSVSVDNIEKYNFTDILSIGIPTPYLPENNIRTEYINCLDLPETKIEPVINVCNKFINDSFDKPNSCVLVHCNAGVSRSSTIILGFLILEKNMKFQEAFDIVKSKRPCIRPNDGFLEQLKGLTKK